MVKDTTIVDCVRCGAQTKSGGQCRRTTCKYHKYCYQHAKSIHGLSIKKSRLPNSGNGLFAEKPFKKGEVVAMYSSEETKDPENDEDKSGYGWTTKKGYIVDAASTQSGMGRWSNMCRKQNQRSKLCKGNNVIGVTSRNPVKVQFKALKNIQRGDEIYVSYGRDYFNRR